MEVQYSLILVFNEGKTKKDSQKTSHRKSILQVDKKRHTVSHEVVSSSLQLFPIEIQLGLNVHQTFTYIQNIIQMPYLSSS